MATITKPGLNDHNGKLWKIPILPTKQEGWEWEKNGYKGMGVKGLDEELALNINDFLTSILRGKKNFFKI